MSGTDVHSLNLYIVRNEDDPNCEYHCDAVAARFPTAEEIDFTAGERVPLENADGVVLTGSTASVYEADDKPWIGDQKAFVRELVGRNIPTLGVCFGHQVINSAVGGTVEEIETTTRLVEATLEDDPLFAGVDPVVVSLHGDAVTTPGTQMETIASANHSAVFGTRHRSAPVWTVQFHPELTADHQEQLVDDFGWDAGQFSFEDVTAGKIFDNFSDLVVETQSQSTQPQQSTVDRDYS